MSHQFKRGRKKGEAVPYTIGNLPEIFWGREVIDFPLWKAAARAVGHAGIVDPKDTERIEAAQADMIEACRQAIYNRDGKFFVDLGRCLAAMPKDDWGNDPYTLAIVTAYSLIYFKNPAGKGMKLTKQDVCKLACTLLPPTKNYETMRVNIFKKMHRVMPDLAGAVARDLGRSNLKTKATKRRVTRST